MKFFWRKAFYFNLLLEASLKKLPDYFIAVEIVAYATNDKFGQVLRSAGQGMTAIVDFYQAYFGMIKSAGIQVLNRGALIFFIFIRDQA